MGFSRQEYWSGLPFPPLGDLPNPGIKPASLVSPTLAGGFLPTESPGKPMWPHGQTLLLPRLCCKVDCLVKCNNLWTPVSVEQTL